MMVWIFTARPEIIVAEYRADKALSRSLLLASSRWLALPQMTRPFSSITTSTLTAPDTLFSLALSGYMGFGLLIAPAQLWDNFNSPLGFGLSAVHNLQLSYAPRRIIINFWGECLDNTSFILSELAGKPTRAE